ncbi:TPR domain-containing protein [Rutstroemia sp. NJR-2017a BBW]|nr:TPR domain-containing protein [Rutstroemia sp. NJR-2017a BBW]
MLEELCPSLKLNPVKPTPSRDEILEHLRTCKIFHFASHGQSNPLEPSESCLVLEVADLRDCKLQENSPFLAYLSACSTKANKADRLVDEEIHLVSACQLAGFQHVIGTLWEVSDEYCVGVARVLYETIKEEGMIDNAVYKGLHRAVKALRDKDITITQTEESDIAGSSNKPRESDWVIPGGLSQIGGPLRWAAYIHAGL